MMRISRHDRVLNLNPAHKHVQHPELPSLSARLSEMQQRQKQQIKLHIIMWERWEERDTQGLSVDQLSLNKCQLMDNGLGLDFQILPETL